MNIVYNTEYLDVLFIILTAFILLHISTQSQNFLFSQLIAHSVKCSVQPNKYSEHVLCGD